MPLSPIRFRRASKAPFSFLFPMKGVGLTIVSCAVRDALGRHGVGNVEFSDLEGYPDAALMHILVEAPFSTSGLPDPCSHCGAVLLDAAARGAMRQRVRLLSVDVQVALGYGVVLSERLLDSIRDELKDSACPPTWSAVE